MAKSIGILGINKKPQFVEGGNQIQNHVSLESFPSVPNPFRMMKKDVFYNIIVARRHEIGNKRN